MALNPAFIQRPAAAAKVAENNFYWAVALFFPLLVFAGYMKTYYLSAFFPDARPVANQLVHFHGIVMSVWVLYFTSQILLARTKNLKLHMSMGWVGIGLAALVIGVGIATAYDSHVVRHVAPAGINPYSFLVIPLGDLAYFAGALGLAIYHRKRPAEHKALMFMTAVNFVAPAIARLPFAPADHFLLFAFGVPCLIATTALAWNTWKHGRLNKVFAAAVAVFCLSQLIRIPVGMSETWINAFSAVFGPVQ